MENVKKLLSDFCGRVVAYFFAFAFSVVFYHGCAFTFPIKFADGDILTDSEVQEVLKLFIDPMVRASGTKQKIQFFLVNSAHVNAMASDTNIFINVGLIEKSSCAEELIGVLAHEIGHIVCNHSIQMLEAAKNSRSKSVIPILIAAVVAGITKDVSALGQGFIMANDVHSLSLCGFSRMQESAADQFALSVLKKISWPTSGLERFIGYIAKTERSDDQNIYFRTHPVSSERLQHMKKNPYLEQKDISKNTKLPKNFEQLFQIIKTKITAFTSPVSDAMQAVQNLKVNGDFKNYGMAIVNFRLGNTRCALESLNKFEMSAGGAFNKPFIQEIRAQILFEAGKMHDAIREIKLALESRRSDQYMIQGAARIMVESNCVDDISSAIRNIERVLFIKGSDMDAFTWQLLGRAYGKLNNHGRMRACLAEFYAASGDIDRARKEAETAVKKLPKSDVYYKRAREIMEILPNSIDYR
ncbi:M48 family metalloprotease [Candidatus Hydrogenosomobacter endosymbioticus]|uniref:Peptidase M48 n=1 Tax=Candidatus Hydrogenosomobacter endosymbioticus TaxID=2558174 RepID=A0ABM7V9L9_9PROT|nr:M48 family metalloprotease [Candidatus Hydrogenosomobacter endosymbioticus]BDB96157.1 peptidase M48 [Candidatus Hydrogenosomobacter endosymbioticus]